MNVFYSVHELVDVMINAVIFRVCVLTLVTVFFFNLGVSYWACVALPLIQGVS
jgi:hypothetical protein